MKFNEFKLSKSIIEAVNSMGFEEATPVQEKAIPVILENEDLIAVAQTGTGKTAAFAIPIINMLHKQKNMKRPDGVKCIVMVPTHELAKQITEVFQELGQNTRVKAYYVIGALYVKGRAVVNVFKSAYLKNIGISLIYKAIDLINSGKDNSDIVSLYYHDLIEFLLKRNYSVKDKIKLWKDFSKRYKKENGYKKYFYFYGTLNQPTLSDHDEIIKLNEILQSLPVNHKWDQEKKDNITKLLKEKGF